MNEHRAQTCCSGVALEKKFVRIKSCLIAGDQCVLCVVLTLVFGFLCLSHFVLVLSVLTKDCLVRIVQCTPHNTHVHKWQLSESPSTCFTMNLCTLRFCILFNVIYFQYFKVNYDYSHPSSFPIKFLIDF